MRLGAHVSIGGGLPRALDRAEELGCDALQIFVQNSRTWRFTPPSGEDVARFRERHAELGSPPVLCHAIYFINLAAPEQDLYEKSVAALVNTAAVARVIGSVGVVFHVGSHKGAGLAAAMPRVVAGIRQALEVAGDVPLLLENSAGQGDTIGRDVDELAEIMAAVDDPRLGLCLDSCHLFVSGVDVRERADLDDLVRHVRFRMGIERLQALHVNDSAAPLGSNRDRHANIGQGELGEELGTFLGHPAFQNLPAVVETGGEDGRGADAREMAELRRIHELGVSAGGATISTTD